MLEKIEGIVIDVRKHNDKTDIVTLFTRSRGRMAMLSPSARGGRSGRGARLLPLSVVGASVNYHSGKELQRLGAVEPLRVWSSIYFNPVKSALAVFLSEFLNHFLRASLAEPDLWDYIVASIQDIDRAPGNASNLHIAFLLLLLPYAGIEPRLDDYTDGDWFDMREGRFSSDRPLHNDVVEPSEARHIPLLARITMANSRRLRMTQGERRRLLDMILRYYSIHYQGLGNLRSLEVMHEIFS